MNDLAVGVDPFVNAGIDSPDQRSAARRRRAAAASLVAAAAGALAGLSSLAFAGEEPGGWNADSRVTVSVTAFIPDSAAVIDPTAATTSDTAGTPTAIPGGNHPIVAPTRSITPMTPAPATAAPASDPPTVDDATAAAPEATDNTTSDGGPRSNGGPGSNGGSRSDGGASDDDAEPPPIAAGRDRRPTEDDATLRLAAPAENGRPVATASAGAQRSPVDQ
jgi:hypothetical protein